MGMRQFSRCVVHVDKMSTMLYSALIVVLVFTVGDCAIERPRGVPQSRASLYTRTPDNKFQCISDGVRIEFDYVNDDYCDCDDGSDEPGTSACANMKFFCENKGHVSVDVPSSFVNDGICDCCDGSDEYLQDKIQCSNTCDEMGRKRREDMQRERELREIGSKIRKEYVDEGIKQQETNKALVEELEKSKETLVAEREELERRKSEAEAPEKEAKEKHEKAWEEVKTERQAVRDRQKALVAFDQLDANDDNFLTVDEMEKHPCFDKNKDGSVSSEEIKEYLEDLEQAAQDDFLEKIWPNIKEIYKPEEQKSEDTTVPIPTDDIKPPSIAPEVQQVPPPLGDIQEGGAPGDYDDEEQYHGHGDEDGDHGDDDDDDNDDDDDDDDDDHDDDPVGEVEKKEGEEEDKMPDFDEDTKKLIEGADEARRLYEEADKKVKDVESQINTAKKYLEKDFGRETEFAFMYNKCYEYTDREYTYKLCPFDRASQRPKSGGSETTLGNWGHWDGSSDDKYSAQKYEKGQNCWNGPDRSVRVLLQCGSENQLLSASEPSRCEYQFEFSTPARCTAPTPEEYQDTTHDEL